MSIKEFIDFRNKYVIITGATSGIGRAIAIALSKFGARLILSGRDDEKLQEVLQSLEGDDHHTLCIDLYKSSDILPKIKLMVKKVGPIYGLCHSAGITKTLPLNVCSTDHVQDMLNVNLLAGIEIARTVVRRDIIEKNGGSILFISAIYGLVGMPGEIGYSASKGAIIALARSMAIELARRNIRVNVISPGLVITRMAENSFSVLSQEQIDAIKDAHPLGVGEPDDVARAAVFLLAPESKWITGTNFIIDGGYTAR